MKNLKLDNKLHKTKRRKDYFRKKMLFEEANH